MAVKGIGHLFLHAMGYVLCGRLTMIRYGQEQTEKKNNLEFKQQRIFWN